jgi:2-polyprenyl-3-methyl-5-hydroxy-6-metoxy-1,4-benzoquinol methylase
MKCKTGAKALLARKILDVGCGAGSHSLYLQNRNLEVCSIDISPNAIEACQS